MSRNSQAKRKSKHAKKTRKRNLIKDKTIREKLRVPHIYFDESGNTGSNLLDKDQTIFTLASCQYSDAEAEKLLGLIGSKSAHEIHFKRLKRRKAGQDGIVRLMSSKLICKDKIAINIFHKEFMLASKIVDILIEHMMHLRGEDLYLNGQNIALSNMLYYCLGAFCDDDSLKEMYDSFIKMIKEQTDEAIDDFYNSVESLIPDLRSKDFEKYINMILETRRCVKDALNGIDKFSLDPSIPALFAQCVNWGEKYPKGFHVIHDDSHTIEKQRLLFAQFMDWTQDDIELGYDRRKYKLPLKGKSLTFSSSDSHYQLQVADVIASSFAYWAAGVSRGEKDDYLFLELEKLNFDRFIGHNKIWPTKDVSPEDLGTVHDGGLNAAAYTSYFLMNAEPNPQVAT
ncbi:DUF3800 domain-containing protein [Halomonas sp. C22]|uniref:DUF3800 domain-containing protein n=1 Tax=Halomonas sp. C22 TaxID=2580567 RepID=UPI00119FED0F|nr:DUF3800 domain-containing protein [Halomonas sp. C22]